MAENRTVMKITFLGTGTSTGVPMIGCDCPVCSSDDPRNKRLRAALYVEAAGQHIIVDTPPDFRTQALTFKIPRVDAVLFTHAHADHILGFDDIRRFNTMQDAVIPAYAAPATITDLKRIFDYIKEEKTQGVYRPRIRFNTVTEAFSIGDLHIKPLQVEHGPMATFGYLFRNEDRTFAYVPDCKSMSDNMISELQGLDVMILDGLRHRPHIAHITIEESISLLKRIKARTSYIIHMCHDIDHAETQKALPDSINLSCDGLVLKW